MGFEEAQKYRDEYIQSKKDAGLQVSDRNGFYVSSTIKDQGKTGSLHTCVQKRFSTPRSLSGFSFLYAKVFIKVKHGRVARPGVHALWSPFATVTPDS